MQERKIMKELLEDFNREQFTLKEWMWYGVAYPLGVIILAMLFS